MVIIAVNGILLFSIAGNSFLMAALYIDAFTTVSQNVLPVFLNFTQLKSLRRGEGVN